MRALLIAGNEDAAGQVEWMLIDDHITLDVAMSASQGVSKARQGTFDVILLDPRLPDASGPEALHNLRREAIKPPVVIVFSPVTSGVAFSRCGDERD